MSQIERETASNHLPDVLALSAQQGHALHVVHSVVCFHTKPWVWLLRSVSPSGRIIGCCAWSCSSLSRFMAASPAPEYLLLYISILRQQSCPMRHSKVDEKIEGTFQRFLWGHLVLNHCHLVGNRRDLHYISCCKGLPQNCFYCYFVVCDCSFCDIFHKHAFCIAGATLLSPLQQSSGFVVHGRIKGQSHGENSSS